MIVVVRCTIGSDFDLHPFIVNALAGPQRINNLWPICFYSKLSDFDYLSLHILHKTKRKKVNKNKTLMSQDKQNRARGLAATEYNNTARLLS